MPALHFTQPLLTALCTQAATVLPITPTHVNQICAMRGLLLPAAPANASRPARIAARSRQSASALAAPVARAAANAPRGRRRGVIVASLDYIATASDEGVLKLPARTELDVEEIKGVFGYPR